MITENPCPLIDINNIILIIKIIESLGMTLMADGKQQR